MPASLIITCSSRGRQVELHDVLTYAGIFFGGILLALAGYRKKPTSSATDTVVAGVGLEFGNRMQVDHLVSETKRCADYLSSIASSMAELADRKQALMEDKVDEMHDLLERLAASEKERRG